MSQTLSDRSKQFNLLGVAVLAALAVLGVSSRAFAFNNPSDFGKFSGKDVTSLGGGAGRYFTGSPADGYSCEVCHSHKTSTYSFPLIQKGLPLDGYVPDMVYRIELSSPLAADAALTARSQGLDPVTTLTAEFISEDGGPAGTVYFANPAEVKATAFPGQWCSGLASVPADMPERVLDQYGLNIYAQDTGRLATEITMANAEERGVSSCTTGKGEDDDGDAYERRCIVALKPCGANTIKFMWKSPSDWSGPIWFSAGMVTTYDRSTLPDDSDFVSTLSVPLNPGYEGSTYENVLNSGCSVVEGPMHNSSRANASRSVGLAALWLLGFVFVRSRNRRAAFSSLVVVLTCLGCNDGDGLVTKVEGAVGAYEVSACTRKCAGPIMCRDSAWPDAGTPEGAAMARDMVSAVGAKSSPSEVAAGAGGPEAMAPRSLGSVVIDFLTTQPPGVESTYAKKCDGPCQPHYVAAWLEDDEGLYVRTLLDQRGGYTLLSIPTYVRLGSDCQVPAEVIAPDVMSMATRFVHSPHHLVWDGLLGSGHLAAKPGLYHLMIELAIDEEHPLPLVNIPIMFGDAAPFTQMLPPEPVHTGVTIVYAPTP